MKFSNSIDLFQEAQTLLPGGVDSPETRAILDGLDYAPMFSAWFGLTTVSYVLHAFTVVYPHGPALEPALASSMNPEWKTHSIAFASASFGVLTPQTW